MASRLLRTAQQSYQRLPQWTGSEKYQTSTNTLHLKKARIPLLLAFAASVLLYLFSKSGSVQGNSSYTSVQEWAREEGGRALLDATFEERIASWNATPTQNTSDFMMLNLGNCPASKSRGGVHVPLIQLISLAEHEYSSDIGISAMNGKIRSKTRISSLRPVMQLSITC